MGYAKGLNPRLPGRYGGGRLLTNYIDEVSPAELLCLLSRSRSPIDGTKDVESLSVGELMLLQEHPDLLDLYLRDRAHHLTKLSKEEEISENDRLIGELIKEYYGHRRC